MATNLSHYLTRGVAAAVAEAWRMVSIGATMDALGFDMARFDRRFDSRHPALLRRPINENPANPLTLSHLPQLDLARPERSGGHSVSAVNWPNLLTINKIKRVDTPTRRADNGNLET